MYIAPLIPNMPKTFKGKILFYKLHIPFMMFCLKIILAHNPTSTRPCDSFPRHLHLPIRLPSSFPQRLSPFNLFILLLIWYQAIIIIGGWFKGVIFHLSLKIAFDPYHWSMPFCTYKPWREKIVCLVSKIKLRLSKWFQNFLPVLQTSLPTTSINPQMQFKIQRRK